MSGCCDDFPFISQKLQLIPVMYQPVCMEAGLNCRQMAVRFKEVSASMASSVSEAYTGNGKGLYLLPAIQYGQNDHGSEGRPEALSQVHCIYLKYRLRCLQDLLQPSLVCHCRPDSSSCSPVPSRMRFLF